MPRVLAAMLVTAAAMSGCGGALQSLYLGGRESDPYGQYGPYGHAGYPDAVYAQPFDYTAQPPYASLPPLDVYGPGLPGRGAGPPEIDDEDEANEERAERDLERREAEERRVAANDRRSGDVG